MRSLARLSQFVMVVCALALPAVGLPARAATYYVAPGGDDTAAGTNWATAKQSIQAAIDVTTGGDTVLVSNGVYASGGRVVHGAMTNRVAITNAITVTSVNGPAFTTIRGAWDPVTTNGDAAVRCVYVGGGATLAGFTLSGGATRLAGDITFEQAGGGSFHDSSAVISNCVYLNNTAYNGGGSWGGNIVDCEYRNNRAVFAGGGALFGVFDRCRFISNHAAYGGGTDGATVRNSLYSGNHATVSGGASYLNTLVNCTLVGNSSAIEAGGSAFDALTNCIVYFNTAPVSPNHTNSTFAYSCTTPDPGGVGNTTNDPRVVTLDDPHLTPDSPCIGQGNTADAFGAADLDGNPRVFNGTVDMGCYEVQATSPYRLVWTNSPSPVAPYSTWNTAAHTIQDAVDAASNGDIVVVADGVYATGSRVVHGSMSNRVAITNAITVRSVNGAASTIIVGAHDSASVTNGDAAIRCVYLGANATLAGFTLTNGATRAAGDVVLEQSGGGVLCADGSSVLRDCILDGNSAAGFGGGAANGSLTTCILRGNFAARAGGAYNATLDSCLLSGNTASDNGGGVQAGTLYGCTLLDNRCADQGGGAYAATLHDCVLVGNKATTLNFSRGGGVDSSAVFNSILTSNTAASGGGAAASTLHGSLLNRNTAANFGGGAYESTLNNCTLTENAAPGGFGGGIYSGTLINSIAYFNTALVNANYYIPISIQSSCTAPHPGGDNFDTPPQFVNAAGGDYRLAPLSPCIDRGNNGSVSMATDLDGNPRIQNTVVDVGAYESPAGIGIYSTNGILIRIGSASPSVTAGTDFGQVPVATGELVRVFTVSNASESVLTIAGASITGVNTGDFSVLSFPAILAPGAVSNLPVRFDPTAFGSRSAAVVVHNSDPVRSNYAFAVRGIGSAPVLVVKGQDGLAMTNGDATPSRVDGTDYGVVAIGVPDTHTFTIANTGTLDLHVQSVTTSGPGASSFDVLSAPMLVSPGGESNLLVRFEPVAIGDVTATVAVVSDDLVQTNFTFTLQGRGTVAGAHYVATNSPTPAAPYASWETAAHTIQDAIDWCAPGDEVLVTNGVYDTGGTVVYGTLSNRVVVRAGVTVRSVNGPDHTTILGAGPPGPAAVRCVLVESNASLSGFTLTGGATLDVGDNITLRNGGGVWCETSGIVSNCMIISNAAFNVGGGAAFGTYFNCVLANNSAAGGGGAYSATLDQCTIAGNQVTVHGGGAWECTLHNSLVVDNTAAGEGGGAYRSSAINCTIANNTAGTFGGGTYQGTNRNSIVYFNTAATGPDHYQGLIEYSCTTPDPGGTGNITGDPGFVNLAASDFRLVFASPCRDAGTNLYAFGSVDLAGQPRLIGPSVDMGAYERQTNTVWFVTTNGSDAANGESWSAAKQTIQAAADAAVDGDSVLVSNGVYDIGSRITPGYDTSNRLVIAKDITVHGVNGPFVTIIKGVNAGDTPASVRCVYMTAGLLSGFTLTNGYAPAIGLAYAHENRAGGGAFAVGGSLSNCFISGNAAAGVGGGVFAGSLHGCLVSGNLAPNGAGAYSSGLDACTISNNTATAGGGGVNSATLTNCTLIANTAQMGGGAYSSVLAGVTISGNSAFQGGGVYASTLENCLLAGNQSGDRGGGAMLSTLIQCTLTSNSSTFAGGGASDSTLSNSLVVANSANFSGGTHLGTNINTTLRGNVAGSSGGGAGFGTLVNCVVVSNRAQVAGGTAFCTIQNSLIFYNSASFAGGSDGDTLRNCTVVGNTASNDVGGCRGGALYNSIVFFNVAPSNANWQDSVFHHTCTTPMPTLGTGNFTNDPTFEDVMNGDYRLAFSSPGRDTGNNANAPAGPDLDGNLRFVNVYVDLGAYEFQGAGQGDLDGDGMGNGDEGVAGSDFANSNNVWEVSGLGSGVVAFASLTGRVYAVDRNDHLFTVPQVWTEFTNNIPGTGGPLMITDPLPGTNRSYRVRVKLQ